MRDRRVQFLPVQWRTSFKLGADEERRREDAGIDNEFTLNGERTYPRDLLSRFLIIRTSSDITIKNTVPYVRELMNNVLIDIPYFMR